VRSTRPSGVLSAMGFTALNFALLASAVMVVATRW
jgi:hypothetical protein